MANSILYCDRRIIGFSWSSLLIRNALSLLVCLRFGETTIASLVAGGKDVSSLLSARENKVYTLNASVCSNSGHVNLQALNIERKAEMVGSSLVGKGRLMLMVNTLGLNPEAVPLGSGVWTWNNGTVTDFTSFQLVRMYQFVTLDVSKYSTANLWKVSVLNDDSLANMSLSFTLRAWCSEHPACPMNCSMVGICSQQGMCECWEHRGGRGCLAVVHSLQNGSPMKSVVPPGSWSYFSIKLPQGQQKLLVEMSRQFGDPVLFVKPKEEGFVPGGVPTEFDFQQFADVPSFTKKISFHRLLLTNLSQGSFALGVYNSDLEVAEASHVSIRASFASQSKLLCPMNCSFPQGRCAPPEAPPLNYSCVCEPGFAGSLCHGSLQNATLTSPASGSLQPRQWAYVAFAVPAIDSGVVLITFTREGGQPILLVQANSVPSLQNNSFQFTSLEASQPLSSLFSLYFKAPKGGTFYFGVFNSDQNVQSLCHYTLSFSLPASALRAKSLSGANLALILTLLLCLSICFSVLLCRLAMQHCRRRAEASQEAHTSAESFQGPSLPLSTPADGLEPSLVASFPQLPFSLDLFSCVEEAVCSVCLGEYSDSDLLRRLPQCSHLFHLSCIDQWLASHSSCPLCRVCLKTVQGPEGGSGVGGESGADGGRGMGDVGEAQGDGRTAEVEMAVREPLTGGTSSAGEGGVRRGE